LPDCEALFHPHSPENTLFYWLLQASALKKWGDSRYHLNEPGLAMYNNKSGWPAEIVDKKVTWSAAMLQRAKADVFGFQELWHRDTLKKVVEKAGLSAEYSLLAPDNHHGKSITCAAAVRKDMLEGDPAWITDFPPSFRLQSKGEDKQTAAMFVDIAKFSRPVLHFRIKPRRNQEALICCCCIEDSFLQRG